MLTIKRKILLFVITALASLVLLSIFGLRSEMAGLIEDRKLNTKHVVESAYGVLDYYFTQQQLGKLTEDQAKAAAFGVVRTMRYGGSEYFWVNDLQHVMVVHPMSSDLEGKSVADIKDASGRYLFRDFVELATPPCVRIVVASIESPPGR